MPCPLLISSQSDYFIWHTVQIQINWLLKKPTDLDLHSLLRQGLSCSAREGLIFHVWIMERCGTKIKHRTRLRGNGLNTQEHLALCPWARPTLHLHCLVPVSTQEELPRTVIYLQLYTYASQDLLGLYKVSPTRKSLRPLQNFPL